MQDQNRMKTHVEFLHLHLNVLRVKVNIQFNFFMETKGQERNVTL